LPEPLDPPVEPRDIDDDDRYYKNLIELNIPPESVNSEAVYYEWSEEEQKWNLAFGMDIVDNREIPNGEFDGQLLAIEYEVD